MSLNQYNTIQYGHAHTHTWTITDTDTHQIARAHANNTKMYSFTYIWRRKKTNWYILAGIENMPYESSECAIENIERKLHIQKKLHGKLKKREHKEEKNKNESNSTKNRLN